MTIILLTVFSCGYVAAETLADSAEIHFRQSKSVLDPHFKGNGASLDSLAERIDAYRDSTSRYSLKGIRVVGAASPEGSVAINRRLSEQRASRIFNYFYTSRNLPDSLVTFDFVGRDWSGLRTLVLADSQVPYRSEVLATLDDIISSVKSNGGDDAQNLQRIKALRGGQPYRYMYRTMFPQLRRSRLFVDYSCCYQPVALDRVPASPLYVEEQDIAFMPIAVVSRNDEGRPFYMGLKTNMLFDALALPNIGAELYLGKDWSAVANWTYGWWDNDNRHRYWRAYGGDIAVRRWFGAKAEEKPLTGHHIGVFAGVVTYDFEFGGKGYMGGLPRRTLWDRCNLVTGVEYGYSLPVARRINIDFTIGIGYMGGKYLEYVPKNNHYVWQRTRRLNWFGPTKAEISLVWLLGNGNYNKKFDRKGGAL